VLLVIFSFISYIVVTPRLGIYMYHPIPHYLGMLVGVGLLVFLMKKKFTKPRLAATIFSVFMVCFFFWYTTVFSDYENTPANISTGKVAGESLKQINLVKIDGKKLVLEEVFNKNKGTLVVFARGAW
jgi:hypothetical protein